MASYNRVVLMGNLTADIDLRYTPNNTAVTDITIAINDKRKSPTGEWVDEVVFVDVTLWGRTAEVAGEYLGKGSPIFIEGRLKLDKWETDGQKRSKLRVVCEKMQMIGGRGEGGTGSGGSARGGRGAAPRSQPQYDEAEYSQGGDEMPPPRSQAAPSGPAEDDIPF